jgi:hypothetical protein
VAIALAVFQNRRWRLVGGPLALALLIVPNLTRPF